MIFADRNEAGALLADRVADADLEEPVVLALLRGGVPVAIPVAERLGCPLDVLFVRKIGAPGHEELAIGAVVDGTNPQLVLNEDVLRMIRVDQTYIDRTRDRELQEIERRREIYGAGQEPVDIRGRTAVVVDDGVATGATVRAAMAALEQSGAGARVLATPVIAPDTAQEFREDGIQVIDLAEPSNFMAVGQFYRNFSQVEDNDVISMLRSVRGQNPH